MLGLCAWPLRREEVCERSHTLPLGALGALDLVGGTLWLTPRCKGNGRVKLVMENSFKGMAYDSRVERKPAYNTATFYNLARTVSSYELTLECKCVIGRTAGKGRAGQYARGVCGCG